MKLQVKVIPKAKQNRVIPLGSNRYQVKVMAPPSQGKANQMVVKLLADYFRVKRNQVEITRGQTSRCKQVCIYGPSAQSKLSV